MRKMTCGFRSKLGVIYCETLNGWMFPYILLLKTIQIISVSDLSDNEEGTSPNNKSGGSKKERYFWQYNVQAKGPKGQKIVVETKMEDPHVLNEIVDPVFSGDVQLQGIKHR